MPADIFTEPFLTAVQSLIERHHTIYPRLPPQGLFFEALVQQAFRTAGYSHAEVVPTTPNSPQHDLLVSNVRLSIKSETGKATKQNRINITKLCTTETGEWNAEALVRRALDHLDRYDRMLMLQAIWRERLFDYQLVEIPPGLLNRMKDAQFFQVGKRPGRRSVAGDVMEGDKRIFHVHFDGADGKCQIQHLLVEFCRMLRQWQQPIP